MPVPIAARKVLWRAVSSTTVACAVIASPVPALAGSAPVPTPTSTSTDVYVEVTPSTVEAGGRVAVRANCRDNDKPAVVRSDAFARLVVVPAKGLLAGTTTVPEDQDPRAFTVRLACPGGATATTTLHVVARTRPSQGPATGFGGTAGGGWPAGLLIWGGLVAIAAGGALGLLRLRARSLG